MENQQANKGPMGPGGPGPGPMGPGGPGPEAASASASSSRTYNADVFTKRYLDSLLIEMRLVDSGLASTDFDFFGTELKTPIMFGVMAGYDKEKKLMLEEADACIETGTAMWMSQFFTDDEVKQCIDRGAKVVRGVKPLHDNAKLIDIYKKEEDMGCIAVASDLDHAYNESGGYDTFMSDELGPKSSLGANGVCTARAAMKSLVKGKDAMITFMNTMTGNLRHIMNRTSSPDVKHIDPSVIHQITV